MHKNCYINLHLLHYTTSKIITKFQIKLDSKINDDNKYLCIFVYVMSPPWLVKFVEF